MPIPSELSTMPLVRLRLPSGSPTGSNSSTLSDSRRACRPLGLSACRRPNVDTRPGSPPGSRCLAIRHEAGNPPQRVAQPTWTMPSSAGAAEAVGRGASAPSRPGRIRGNGDHPGPALSSSRADHLKFEAARRLPVKLGGRPSRPPCPAIRGLAQRQGGRLDGCSVLPHTVGSTFSAEFRVGAGLPNSAEPADATAPTSGLISRQPHLSYAGSLRGAFVMRTGKLAPASPGLSGLAPLTFA